MAAFTSPGYHRTGTPRPRVRILDADPEYPIEHEQLVTGDLTASAIGRLALAESDPDADIHRRGYALQVDELRAGAGCLAVPIRNRAGTLIAALTLSTTSVRLNRPESALDLLLPRCGELEIALTER